MNKTILYLLIYFMSISSFLACKKDMSTSNGNPGTPGVQIGSFSVNVVSRAQVQAKISWTKPTVPAGASLSYKVYLSSNLIGQSLTDTNFVIPGLVYNQAYSGRVVAYISATDSAFTNFSIGVYDSIPPVPGPYSYLNGYYKVTETEVDINNTSDVNNSVFTARVSAVLDSNIAFFQSTRIPSTWWSYNFGSFIRPSQNDTMYSVGTTVNGRVLNANTIRVHYFYGISSTVFKVDQLWEKLPNPADTSLYTYQWPIDGPGMIKTFAGNRVASAPYGQSGDGGSALNASLAYPISVGFDLAGNAYISDGGSISPSAVRKVNTAGIIDRFAGTYVNGFSGDGGPAVNAQVNVVQSVVCDPNGNIYIGDLVNRVIRKVNSSGIITTIAGTPNQPGYTGDGGPATSAKIVSSGQMALDASGNLFFADVGNHVIRKINVLGIISTVAGSGISGNSGDGGSATLARLNSPWAVKVDAIGNLYIADKENHAIRKVNTSGIITSVVSTPSGINAGFSGDGGPATLARINSPRDIALDAAGNLYVSDYGNNRIRKVSTSGIITTFAGNGTGNTWKSGPLFYNGDNGPATSATIWAPQGIFCTSTALYVVDANHRVRRILF